MVSIPHWPTDKARDVSTFLKIFFSYKIAKIGVSIIVSIPHSPDNAWAIYSWLCWGLTSKSTIFQSCRDGAIASWVINQYFRGVKCLAQGHNTAAVGLEPQTSRSGVRHSTTEPPRSPLGYLQIFPHFQRLFFLIKMAKIGVSIIVSIPHCPDNAWAIYRRFHIFKGFFLIKMAKIGVSIIVSIPHCPDNAWAIYRRFHIFKGFFLIKMAKIGVSIIVNIPHCR